MAGSLSHIVDPDGRFSMDLIENLGDAHEALEECFEIIRVLTNGQGAIINPICEELSFPCIAADMSPPAGKGKTLDEAFGERYPTCELRWALPHGRQPELQQAWRCADDDEIEWRNVPVEPVEPVED